MSHYIPNIRGPKLFPFNGDFDNAQFIKLLDSGDENAPNGGAHGRVFQVRINGKIYCVKIFKFVSLDEIRPSLLMDENHPISDNVIRHQLDPFFAECRAFGRLTAENKDQDLAVRCHGYVYLHERVEHQINREFCIHDWNRSSENMNEPLRAIVKNCIKYRSSYRPSRFSLMRKRLGQLNEMGIYNMDIRKENYLGGRLFDFSTAITTPHINFSLDFRTQAQIIKDIRYDLACFDNMVELQLERAKQTKTTRWKNIRSLQDSSTK